MMRFDREQISLSSRDILSSNDESCGQSRLRNASVATSLLQHHYAFHSLADLLSQKLSSITHISASSCQDSVLSFHDLSSTQIKKGGFSHRHERGRSRRYAVCVRRWRWTRCTDAVISIRGIHCFYVGIDSVRTKGIAGRGRFDRARYQVGRRWRLQHR